MMAEKMKPVVSELVFGKINDRMLNGDYFLQQKRVVDIHVTERAKDHYLTDDFLSPKA